MILKKIKESMKTEGNNKKKIENIVFLIIILIITIIILNYILKGDKPAKTQENTTSTYKTLATTTDSEDTYTSSSGNDLQKKLETILGTIKGVGKVNVFISYSESSKTIAMYDEKTTTSSTEETDSSGGLRNTTSTQTQKDVIFSGKEGNQVPMTQKIIMPTIEGAVITAQGAKNTNVKTNIINAVKSATGLSIDKIQVFEMEG